MNACLETVRLFNLKTKSFFLNKNKKEDESRHIISELLKLVSQVIKRNPEYQETLYSHNEALNIILILIDSFMAQAKVNDTVASVINNLITEINHMNMNISVNFKKLDTIKCLHAIIVNSNLEASRKMSESFDLGKFKEHLNFFYMNLMEMLVFTESERSATPEDSLFEEVLKAISESRIENSNGSFEIMPVYRSLLIRIVFRCNDDKVILNFLIILMNQFKKMSNYAYHFISFICNRLNRNFNLKLKTCSLK